MRFLPVFIYFLPWITLSVANVEKTIFLGPEVIHIPQKHPNLDDLRLAVVTPSHPTLRTQLVASFPKLPESKGMESWFLLHDLRQEQRYEVRICWAATVGSVDSRYGFLIGWDGLCPFFISNRQTSLYVHIH